MHVSVEVQKMLESGDNLLLDLGCGSKLVSPEYVGIDISPDGAATLVGEALAVLSHFPDASVDGVYSRHFLEHVADPEELLREIARVCKAGALITIIVPHYSSSFFYSDVTHKSSFGLYSFSYLANGRFFKRDVPSYARIRGLELIDVKLGFKSSKVWPVRYGIKWMIGLPINRFRYTQEFWEESFAWIFPAYEITYSLRVEN